MGDLALPDLKYRFIILREGDLLLSKSIYRFTISRAL